MKMPGPLDFFARQARVRPLAAFSAMFLAGALLARRIDLSWTLWLGLCVLALAAAALLRRFGARSALAMVMLAGLLGGGTRMALEEARIPAVETRYSVEMVGEIIGEPFTNPNTGRRISRFRVETVNGRLSGLILRLYLRGDAGLLEEIDVGQRLSLKGHIWASDPPTNPYEFDFGDYLRRDGMAAYATAKIEDVTVLETRRSARTLITDIRRAIAGRIDRLFPESMGLVRALVLGDRSLLGEEMREALRDTGTAHLIAISGLHVSVLAAAVALALRRLTSRRIAVWAALAALAGYGALIGFGAPFVRASVMFAALSLASAPGLPSDGVTRLGAAMLLLLMIRPMEAANSGFALSFAASAGIILLAEPLATLLHLEGALRRRKGLNWLGRRSQDLRIYFAGLLIGSLAAQLAILPVVIASFGVQSVLSLPFNLVCVPLCMLGYLAALASLLLSVVWLPLGIGPGWIADGLLSLLTRVTRWSAALPLTGLRVGRYPWWLIAAHIGLILAASGLSRVKLGRRKWLPLLLIAVAALSSLNTWARALPFSVTFLDADQADCAVVRTQGHTWLVDAGDTYTPAADYLSATCLRLDGVVLSHPHQDHAGGLTDILTVFRPGAIYVPVGWDEAEDVSPAVTEGMELAEEMGVPIVELAAGDVIPLSRDAALEVLSPDRESVPGSVNDMSLLTLVSCGGQRVLFTGDLTTEGEPEHVPDADILKVAHHGAKDGSSAAFLAAVSPKIAVVSVGENNFGHPSEEVLARLEDTGARILTTRDEGAISMIWLGGAWRIRTYLGGGR